MAFGSDATATGCRFIAEATRTIVSTTLLASFAQEECSNVWTFLNTLPSKDKKDFWEKIKRERQAASESANKNALGDGSSKSKTGNTKPKTDDETIESEFVHLAKNCQSNETSLIQQAALFTPQYTMPAAAPPRILGGQDGVTMSPKESASFIVVSGVPPYHISGLTPNLKSELTASIPSEPVDGIYQLNIERPNGATRTSGKSVIYVVDSVNSYGEIAIKFSSEPAKQPVAKK